MELLAELEDVGAVVSFPLRCTQRIKYTCFDVSKNLLVFGATSGGLYVFSRDPCVFIQLIPNKEGSIIKIKISSDEKCVAFATHKGNVCVSDCGKNVEAYIKSPILQISKEHQGNEVTFLLWNEHSTELYIGDDVGTVSVLRISKSFTKNVFQTMTTSLMHLDSRIIQLDINSNLLLVSTLTRCFICDTLKEHYAQIGQKLRDGEYGTCFFPQTPQENGSSEHSDIESDSDGKQFAKSFSIASESEIIEYNDNIKIFCARPGSRIWEVQIDGTVVYTHQFKQLLSVPPTNIFTNRMINEEVIDFPSQSYGTNPQSLNFPVLYMFMNRYIFTFKRDGIYLFDPKTPSVVLWSDRYANISDCKVINDFIYIWQSSGNISILSFHTLETFLIKCYLNQKYKLCAKICDIFSETILYYIPTLHKITLIAELGDKLRESNDIDLLNKISPILEEISRVQRNVSTKSKSGIHIVENCFNAKTSSNDSNDSDSSHKSLTNNSDSTLFHITPVIKELSHTVSDKFNLGTKNLKKTWDHIEDKMKKINLDKTYNRLLDVRNGIEGNNIDIVPINENNEEVLVDTCIEQIPSTNGEEKSHTQDLSDMISEYDINKEKIQKYLHNFSCDIKIIYQVIQETLEHNLISSEYSSEYSKFSEIFLKYISASPDIDNIMNTVIADESICSYFLKAFIDINTNNICISNCECGYPLPTADNTTTPLYNNLLNNLIEKKWELSQSEQCYDICKRVPYVWKKILLLRKDEDLKNLLLLILQMLDEELLFMYLPQFTIDTWERAIQLLSTLRKHECLNCGKKFNNYDDLNIFNKSTLDWDNFGRMMIISIGPNKTIEILQNNSRFIPSGELTLKFYHSCMFSKMFEKYDPTITSKLIGTIYDAYNYEDAILEMSSYLKQCLYDKLHHTALPFILASKTMQWGLNIMKNISKPKHYKIGMNIEQSLNYVEELCPNNNCLHCCLTLSTRVLVSDGGLWVFSCGHTFHGICLNVLQIKLCPFCLKK